MPKINLDTLDKWANDAANIVDTVDNVVGTGKDVYYNIVGGGSKPTQSGPAPSAPFYTPTSTAAFPGFDLGKYALPIGAAVVLALVAKKRGWI